MLAGLVLLRMIVYMVLSLAITLLTVPLIARICKRLSLVGVDIHKPNKPMVPKIGGAGIVIGTSVSLALSTQLGGLEGRILLAFLACTGIAASIGLLEDIREINPVVKPIALALAGVPIVALGTYSPQPVLPFVGETRLTLVYPILVLIAITTFANAVNGIDVLNGSMALTSILALSSLTIIGIIISHYVSSLIGLALIGSLIGFLKFNKYPARVFSGNVGSLFVGSAIGAIAIIGRMEVVALIAMIPQLINELNIILSIGGLKSAKQLSKRPVTISEGIIKGVHDKEAPISLVRMITSLKGMNERDVVAVIVMLSSIASILALITEFLFISPLR